jgi:predicted nucleic-acid-binding protein
MAKMENLIEKRFKSVEEKYREELDLVSEALGKPCIILHVQLPEGCEEYRELFEELPHDEEFMAELQEFIREALRRRAGKLERRENPS